MTASQTAEPLGSIVESVETHRKTVRVCNFDGDEDDLAAIASHFDPHDVDVETVDAPGRPANVVDLLSNGKREATSDAATVLSYVRAWDEAFSVGLQADPPAVVERLDDTFFESYDKKRMVMASRIVEFRSLNVGRGELHAGFQDLAKVDHQRSTYRHLAESGLDVHVYGAPAPETTAGLGVHAHETTTEESGLHWWVAFDGDGDDEEKAVLLAQERAPNRFYGFWTYEPAVVDAVIARMPALQR
jgi:hypothetical protein